MKKIEYVQSAYNGGFPAANEDGVFHHGEGVYLVSRLELDALLETVSTTPKGFRDVYWCRPLQEPFFLEYQNGLPHCPLCGWTDPAGNKESPSDDFKTQHKFIVHVSKPKEG